MNTTVQKLSGLLTSQAFVQQLHRFPPAARRKIMGHAISYHILFPDGRDFDVFMDMQRQRVDDLGRSYHCEYLGGANEAEITTMFIADRVGVQSLETREAQQAVFEYYRERYLTNGYVFHGFNGVFRESIERHGLHPDKRLWNTDEFAAIDGIFRSKDPNSMVFGFGAFSEAAVYVDGHPFAIYRYAVESPEWFGLFAGGGLKMFVEDAHKRSACMRRDYPTARSNIEGLCNEHGLSPAERTRLLDFFDRSWALFVSPQSKPLLAMIDRSAVTLTNPVLQTFDDVERMSVRASGSKNIESSIDMSMSIMRNKKLETVITPEAIHIVELPAYFDVFPEEK